MDFGPLHIGHMYRFSLWLHDILLTAEKEGKVIVLWSYADSRSMFFLFSGLFMLTPKLTFAQVELTLRVYSLAI